MRCNIKVSSATAHSVTLDGDETILTHTLVWTAGTLPSPALKGIACGSRRARRRSRRTPTWRSRSGRACSPSATAPASRTLGPASRTRRQPSTRSARRASPRKNVAASFGVGEREQFIFDTIGQLAVLGHRSAVAEVRGWRFSGFLAFWMWRTVYWLKLPRIERQIRVAVDWTLDLLFPPDTVQIGSGRMPTEEDEHLGEEHDDLLRAWAASRTSSEPTPVRLVSLNPLLNADSLRPKT